VVLAKPAQPVFSFVDTGLLNNDGITNNGVITVNNLEVGATWQYSISSDGFVINCSGLRVKYWACVIYDNTQSIFTYI
jgi:hypothetical protein